MSLPVVPVTSLSRSDGQPTQVDTVVRRNVLLVVRCVALTPAQPPRIP